MSLREKIFQDSWRPEMMFVLMLIVDVRHHRRIEPVRARFCPGVAGVIALVWLLYMASVLPMNMAGLAMIALAIALFIIDVFAPTHGVLTAGGIVAFFLGPLMLFDRRRAGTSACRWPWIVPATVVTALFSFSWWARACARKCCP